jgi:hypothetical protein
MEIEKIQFFDSDEFIEFEYKDVECYVEYLQRYGYVQTNYNLISSYFYLREDEFVEINQFYNEEKNIYITDLWRNDISIVKFATKTDYQTFCVLERFVAMAKNMIDIENNLYDLYKKSDND